ncbi:hypothetical protein [Gluconobacter oxydans]|uniref:hypothetical protein n=1 Tax=Gluconobacter oxydans TaxID=442 RepID=UPI00209EAE38|nr:hypothetical protein [Gluconobacter oxydans]MCP1250013.1 hypothetical protein [Gluconobacter oxydans]
MISFKDFLVSEEIDQYDGIFKITFYMGGYEYYIFIEESKTPNKCELPEEYQELEEVDKFYYFNFDSRENRKDEKTYYARDKSHNKSISELFNLAFLFERSIVIHKKIHNSCLFIAAPARPDLHVYYRLLFKSYMCYEFRQLEVKQVQIKADREEDNVPVYAIR